MAVTPNYSWPVPVNTDYVKDGAEAIKNLGDAIDSTVFGLPAGGLTLISTTTFSAVSSVSFAADTFSSTYRHYKIIIDTTGTSVLLMRFRTAGSDNSTNNYDVSNLQINGNSLNGSRVLGTSFGLNPNAVTPITSEITIFNPKETVITRLVYQISENSDEISVFGTANFKTTTSFDSATFFPNTGTFTGNVSVYGFQI